MTAADIREIRRVQKQIVNDYISAVAQSPKESLRDLDIVFKINKNKGRLFNRNSKKAVGDISKEENSTVFDVLWLDSLDTLGILDRDTERLESLSK